MKGDYIMRKMYSKKKIEKMAEDAAIKSIKSVIIYEGTSRLTQGLEFTNWTLNRAIKDNNTLWFIVTGQIKNTTESSVNLLEIAEFTLPSDIAEKIYKTDGTTIHTGSYGYILGTNGFFAYDVQPLTMNCSGVNKIKLTKSSERPIAGGNTISIDIRIPLFLNIDSVE